jgi:hypothetical protein
MLPLALASGGAAADQVESRQFPFNNLHPNESTSGTGQCTTGALVSGGYAIDGPAGVLAVEASYPSDSRTWLVRLRNISKRSVTGSFWVSVLCR